MPTAPQQAAVREFVESVGAGTLSATAACEDVLAHIERIEPHLGALLSQDREAALTQAAAVDAKVAAGDDPGALAGVSLTVKDVISVAGQPLTAGSKILRGYTPPYTATVAQRLLDAGAVIVGKNNLDEFAMGSSNENSAYKLVHNPWDLARVPGGSSGGSAAAVAAGYGLASLGTDTGGSVRLPAALCGVVGLKPTYGRVSRHGVVAFASSLDQVGPIGRSAADVARIFDVIAGPCRFDSTCVSAPLEPTEKQLERDLSGLRVGVPHQFVTTAAGLHAGVRASTEQAIDTLRSLGAVIVDVELPHTQHSIATYYLVATAEASANLQRYDGVRFGHRAELQTGEGIESLYARSRSEGFGAEVKRRIILGTFALSSGYYDAYYERACRVRRLIHDDYTNALQKCDVLVGPTCPVPAWRLGEHTKDPLAMYLMDIFTTGASLAGVPALSVPVTPADGLPVGLQIIGKHFDEATILRVGHHLGGANQAHLARPDLSELGALS
jgi:aspartyl-tRNA(Asn)/glutamyl-tRNA(Gln) amidotransferase subunit A